MVNFEYVQEPFSMFSSQSINSINSRMFKPDITLNDMNLGRCMFRSPGEVLNISKVSQIISIVFQKFSIIVLVFNNISPLLQ